MDNRVESLEKVETVKRVVHRCMETRVNDKILNGIAHFQVREGDDLLPLIRFVDVHGRQD